MRGNLNKFYSERQNIFDVHYKTVGITSVQKGIGISNRNYIIQLTNLLLYDKIKVKNAGDYNGIQRLLVQA